MDGEISGIIRLKRVPQFRDMVAELNTVLPSRRTGIDLRIQHQFGQHEVGNRQCYPSIGFTSVGAISTGNKDTSFEQFAFHEIEHLVTLRLLHIAHRGMAGSEVGHTPKEIEQIPIADGTECLNFCDIRNQRLLVDHLPMGFKLFDRTVTKVDDLIEIEPGIIEQGVSGIPGVTVEILPDATIVPVDTSCGQDGLVGAEGLQVVDTTDRALESLPFFAAAYIII